MQLSENPKECQANRGVVTQRFCSRSRHQLLAAPCCVWLIPNLPPLCWMVRSASVSYSALYPSSGVQDSPHAQPQTLGQDPLHRSSRCFQTCRHVFRLRRAVNRGDASLW